MLGILLRTQESDGTTTGHVTDASAAIVSGAAVRTTNRYTLVTSAYFE
jgi:hypothetical protein